jgi:hypothetical protein
MLFPLLLGLRSAVTDNARLELHGSAASRRRSHRDDFDPVGNPLLDRAKEDIRAKRIRRNPAVHRRLSKSEEYYNDGETTSCDKPLTRLLAYDRCECIDDAYGDDPREEGCWRCNSTCHPQASCVRGGICECFAGFRGDGVTACEV